MRGEIVQGTVVQFEPAGALIDIGAKATAYMPVREVRRGNGSLFTCFRVLHMYFPDSDFYLHV